MFFPDRIKSIEPNDKVLEIGPGATPFSRSDVFLELKYETEEERIAQSGHVGILETDKQVVYYDGGKFPFKDNEFDYVICSHVLEHVDDVDVFLSEIQRIANKGYLEFPTIYYDYIYNFPEHKMFLLENDGVINWMTKEESGLNKFSPVHKFFYRTCELKYYDAINDFKNYFFQGFEWFDKIKSRHVNKIESLTYHMDAVKLQEKKTKEISVEKMYPYISFKKFLKYKLKKFF
ncbi:methyltransferase domain-containing protein [Seonamhaeicola sp. MEBiC1930]|uniref:class I SAM-dependent methyltransferase n=1 Tax=Seonamhaeicola sp. MEBiC01930 TaxID=2976768 RepID=UPI00324F1A99